MIDTFISVIVPSRGRPRRLTGCLQALADLSYPHDAFEVIVVDDGNEVSLESTVNRFAQVLDVHLVSQENGGPAAARNAGAQMARGEYLVFTDDDCVPATNWLDCFMARFAHNPVCAVGGRTLSGAFGSLYSRSSQILIDYLFSYYNNGSGGARFLTSNNFALSAELFWDVGGFDASMPLAGGEDRELCDRMLYYGHKLVFAPEVITYHHQELTLRRFMQQHYNYGRGACFFHQRRSRRTGEGIRIEPPEFYVNSLRFPFARMNGQQAKRVAGLLALSQVANAVGFASETLRQVGQRWGNGRHR